MEKDEISEESILESLYIDVYIKFDKFMYIQYPCKHLDTEMYISDWSSSINKSLQL